MARHSDDTSDTLGDGRLLNDDKVFDHVRLGYVRSTAELDTGRSPSRVVDVLLDLLDGVTQRNDSDRVGVSLSEDGSESWDLVRLLKRHLLGVDGRGLLDPLVRDLLDPDQVRRGDGLVVREVESELGGCDERSLLVNVVAKDLSKGEVEDVSTGMVVSDGPSSELYISSGHARVFSSSPRHKCR